jgi:hypothetical protein
MLSAGGRCAFSASCHRFCLRLRRQVVAMLSCFAFPQHVSGKSGNSAVRNTRLARLAGWFTFLSKLRYCAGRRAGQTPNRIGTHTTWPGAPSWSRPPFALDKARSTEIRGLPGREPCTEEPLGRDIRPTSMDDICKSRTTCLWVHTPYWLLVRG